MPSSPRLRLAAWTAAAVAAVALAALLPTPADPGIGLRAGDVCPNGTNWDNRIQACR